MNWESLYNLFGIKDFIYYISSSQLQEMLFPVRLVFIFFSVFFLAFVIYFMLNSSWLQYKFLEDVTEFFSWQAYGAREISKRLDKIKKRIDEGGESEMKLALIDADDFLEETLDDRGYEGKSFEEMLNKAEALIKPIFKDVQKAHEARNSIVYDPNYKLSKEDAKRMMDVYEKAISGIGTA